MFVEDLSKSIERIYGALTDEAANTSGLSILRDQVGAEHVLTRHFSPATADRHSSCDHLGEPDRDRFHGVWSSAPFRSLHLQLPLGRAVRMTEFATTESVMRSDLYQEIFRPLEGGLAAFFICRHRTETVVTAVCRSAERRRDFDDRELATIEVLMPHIILADTVGRKIHDVVSSSRNAYAALEELDEGIILLDGSGRVMFANRYAKAIAAEGGISVSSGLVRAASGLENEKLQAAIHGALSVSRKRAERGSREMTRSYISISRPEGKLPLIVRVTPTRVSPEVNLHGDALVTLVVSAPNDVSAAKIDQMSQLFHLTPRETALAAELCRGGSLRAAAAHLGIATSTARQYLKSVFDKTGAHSQARLMGLLSA